MRICDSCQGKKKLLALGNIMKTCTYCGGVGYTDDPSEHEFDCHDDKMDLPKPKKKPGRKPKETVLHV